MDFSLTPKQQAALDAASQRLTRAQGGPDDAVDLELYHDLIDAASNSDMTLLERHLLTEAAARAAYLLPIGLGLMLEGLVPNKGPDGLIAIADGDAPTRYGAQAGHVLLPQGDVTQLLKVEPAKARPVPSNYLYPLGIPDLASGQVLGELPTLLVRKRQRLALVAEAVGAMDAAISVLTDYVGERRQFGRPIGSFQAVHHRIAELSVLLEAGRWLSREAAWRDDEETAALAACHVARSARRFAWEVHQLSGARGFTLELGLYRHSLRLQLLSVEMGGPNAHALNAASLVWPA